MRTKITMAEWNKNSNNLSSQGKRSKYHCRHLSGKKLSQFLVLLKVLHLLWWRKPRTECLSTREQL